MFNIDNKKCNSGFSHGSSLESSCDDGSEINGDDGSGLVSTSAPPGHFPRRRPIARSVDRDGGSGLRRGNLAAARPLHPARGGSPCPRPSPRRPPPGRYRSGLPWETGAGKPRARRSARVDGEGSGVPQAPVLRRVQRQRRLRKYVLPNGIRGFGEPEL
jgi:hypothetical protein